MSKGPTMGRAAATGAVVNYRCLGPSPEDSVIHRFVLEFGKCPRSLV